MNENGPRQEWESPPEREPWLRQRIEQYLDGALGSEETAELDRRLRGDPAALESFMLSLALHARIAWNVRGRLERGKEADGVRGQGERGEGKADFVTPPAVLLREPAGQDVPLFAPRPSSFLLRQLSSGVVFSYVCAVLFLGIGVLAARLWLPAAGGQQPSRYQGVAFRPGAAATRANPAIVGTVTKTRDCRWFDPHTAALVGDAVSVGRRFDLIEGSKEPYDLAIEMPRQPPLCAFMPGTDGLEFCPYVDEPTRRGNPRNTQF